MSNPIATYTFLPWLRQGIVSKVKTEDTLGQSAGPGERAALTITLKVNNQADFVAQPVELIGPGDVIGVSPQAVVRTDPRPWVTDFEPNYLAFIEFYEEDFPWRFTPAHAVKKNLAGSPSGDAQQTKLRPWIFLLALEEGEFEEIAAPGPLAAIRLADTTIPAAILPPVEQAWAWAHVHVSRDITAGGTSTPADSVEALEALLRGNPDNALSRLVCPRKLKPLTAYHAFLIPAFEVGRLAGLGQDTTGKDALAASWGAGQTEYPVYYRWHFRTGERGDFEYLVSLLEAREADARIGVRDMDMQAPNFGATGMGTGVGDEAVMGLEGALKSLSAQPKPKIWPRANPNNRPAFLKDLEALVNLQETLLHPAGTGGHPDPIISPPLYGRWHAPQDRLEVGRDGWVTEINQDPRLRVPAGFGTQVIQAGQEDYMQRAWQQLGDILHANQKIRQVQVSIGASTRIFTRHFANLNAAQKIAITQQVHTRILGSPTTLHQQLKESRLEPAALRPTFRRVFRPGGALMRKAIPERPGRASSVLVKLNEGQIAAAAPKRAPEQQISLNRLAGKLTNKRLLENQLTSVVVKGAPFRPNFRFSIPDRGLPPIVIGGGAAPEDSPEAKHFRGALVDLHDRIQTGQPAPEARPPVEIAAMGSRLEQALNPKTTILQRLLTTILLPNRVNFQSLTETITPVMAHPVFADPMYRPLRDLSSELLIPNLDLIPNNTITLLATNPRFIEAYMVGLNHEMASELLWREAPTDQRGSYFRQFWDVSTIVNRDPTKDPRTFEEELRDIRELHRWNPATALGSHGNRPLPAPGDERLVLLIRGDLLKRYPTAVIFAQQAKWVDDPESPPFPLPRPKVRVLDDGDPLTTIKTPIFKAEIEPDIHFLGFDLTAKQAKGDPRPPQPGSPEEPGWFFVIQERPGEPRFGLDLTEGPPEQAANQLQNWNQLSWNHFGSPDEVGLIRLNHSPFPAVVAGQADSAIRWGSNAGDMAYILYQVPVMVAIHADNMIP